MDLRSYIEELETSGTLPRLRGGRINRCQLVRQCGVHRNAIYNNKAIVELLARLDDTYLAPLPINSDRTE
jgi:hypothetical protein